MPGRARDDEQHRASIAKGCSTGHPPPCNQCGIRRFTFCSALGTAEQGEVAAIATVVGFAPRQIIIHEGDPAGFLFNVTNGTALAYKQFADGRRQVTGILIAGDFLGLAPRGTYVYSVEAITPVTLCRYPRADLTALCRKHPRLEERMFKGLMDEFTLAQDQMLMLGRQSARERVAVFLIHLSDRAAQHGEVANPIDLPMTRADIADFLGLTIETVSRTLTEMKRDGLIAMERPDRIRLEGRTMLSELAQWPNHPVPDAQ